MKSLISLVSLFIFAGFSLAQTAPRGTDIYVFDMKERKGTIKLSKVRNVTNRAGYDNQPSFYNNNQLIYSSYKDGQNDIMRANLSNGKITNLTNTKESEYSPFPLPQRNSFATVRVEKDGSQRLWQFSMDNEEAPRVVFKKIAPVGYFAWNQEQVLMFVLGQPASLVLANENELEEKIITNNVGRSIKTMPKSSDFTFERTEENGDKVIYVLNSINYKLIRVVKKPQGSNDWVITQKGTYITSIGSKLFQFNPKTDKDWKLLTDLGKLGVDGITRMATSENNKRLALVINR